MENLKYYSAFLLIILFCNCNCSKDNAKAQNIDTDKLKLVWADEFNTPGKPGATQWGYNMGNGYMGLVGWGNNELEYYTDRPENVTIVDGMLKITAKRESYAGYDFTSTRLFTMDKFSFKYGRIEARVKLPAGVGTWPTIFLMGDNVITNPWPACGEIDIIEHVGRDLNNVQAALHYPGHSAGGASMGRINIPTATTDFHIYRMDWTPEAINFYADEKLYHSLKNDPSLPFNQKFFLTVNVAMGGNFGGPVDPAFTSAQMLVDYIRVYQ